MTGGSLQRVPFGVASRVALQGPVASSSMARDRACPILPTDTLRHTNHRPPPLSPWEARPWRTPHP
jgi:hypothetical protein